MSQVLYLTDFSSLPQNLLPDGSNFEIILPYEINTLAEPGDDSLTLWLADNLGGECLLLSRFEIDTIEQLVTGSYLYTGSHERSVHFRKPGTKNNSYSINSFYENLLNSKGFIYLNEHQISELNVIERKAWNSSYSPPFDRVISQALLKWNSIHTKKSFISMIEAVSLINTTFSQSDLVRHVKDPTYVSPLVSNALALLKAVNKTNSWQVDDIVQITTKRINNSGIRIDIDTLLRPFVSVDFLSRNFKWSASKPEMFDWENSRIKLERAEKKHQEILKDCYNYFISCGREPMMNRNVDLAVIHNAELSLFEIKSATLENFRPQALKGIIQVLEYAHCFNLAGIKVKRKCLVIECPEFFNDINYYSNFTKVLGVELVLYKQNYEWPLRAENLIGH
jgi:hypothetical protein